MKKIIRKALSVLMVVLAFVITAAFYLYFDLEGILWDSHEQTVITAKKIKSKPKKDYTGKNAGKGIKKLEKKKSWKKMKVATAYATVDPVSIMKTEVYGLGRWSDFYTDKKKKKSKKSTTEAIKPMIDYSTRYSPFYIITLPDGTRILAQMNRGIAKKISKGKEVALPIGRKIEVSSEARELLKEQCELEKVSTKYVFYAIDDEWQGENADAIFWGKIGITIFVFIIVAILLQIMEKAYVNIWITQNQKEERKKKAEDSDEKEETTPKEDGNREDEFD